MTYAHYEKEAEKARKANEALLKLFKKSLEKEGLAQKTITKHTQNIDFFINEFLLYSDVIPANEGASHVSEFLGYWFIRKAMWASPATIKENAASLKKFYTLLCEQNMIPPKELEELKQDIKTEMPEWIATVQRYDDPEIEDMEEVWLF